MKRKKLLAVLLTCILLFILSVPVWADAVSLPLDNPNDPSVEETKPEVPAASGGTSEARDLSAPIIIISASVLVIAGALLVHTIVGGKKTK